MRKGGDVSPPLKNVKLLLSHIFQYYFIKKSKKNVIKM